MSLTDHTRRVASAASYLLPFSPFRRVAGTAVLIPVYHTVSDKHLPHVTHLYDYKSVDHFVRDLRFFLAHYKPVSFDALLKSRDRREPLPKNAVHLTFDDGLRESFDLIAPILAEMKLPATFFLTADFLDNQKLFYKHQASLLVEHVQAHGMACDVAEIRAICSRNGLPFSGAKTAILSIEYQDRHVLDEIADCLGVDCSVFLSNVRPYMTTAQVKQLIEDGFTVGAHSLDHPLYSSIALLDQVDQTVKSIDWLCREFSVDYKAFAFPFNDRDVSRTFFDTVLSVHQDAIFFGTSSMMRDAAPACFQRTIMETLPIPARNMIATRCLAKVIREVTGRNHVVRPVSAAAPPTCNVAS